MNAITNPNAEAVLKQGVISLLAEPGWEDWAGCQRETAAKDGHSWADHRDNMT